MAVTGRAHLDVLAPDLLRALDRTWPSVPARRLAGVLARADREPPPPTDYERNLLALCGITDSAHRDGSPPLAGVCAAVDLGCADAALRPGLIRADPVHLRADPTRLVLFDAATVGLDEAEADALIALLNDAFAADGVVFRRGADASRWYVELADCPRSAGISPARLRGAPLASDAAARAAHAGLERLLTEAQMVLHESPVNLARERAGKAPINSIWPWGGGTLPRPSAARLDLLVSSDFLARACAAHAGTAVCETLADLPAALAQGCARLGVACAPDREEAWPEHFVPLVLEPALAALGDGRLASFSLWSAHDCFRVTRRSRWRFWCGADAFVAACRTRAAARQ